MQTKPCAWSNFTNGKEEEGREVKGENERMKERRKEKEEEEKDGDPDCGTDRLPSLLSLFSLYCSFCFFFRRCAVGLFSFFSLFPFCLFFRIEREGNKEREKEEKNLTHANNG